MKKVKLLLRLSAPLAFFAPFTTCSETFNSNPKIKISATDTTENMHTDSIIAFNSKAQNIHSANKKGGESFLSAVINQIFYPTDDTISGFGAIFLFPNIIGQVAVAVSSLLSLFLIFPWPFLQKSNWRLRLTVMNSFSAAVFISCGLAHESSKLQWGAWLLLGLTVINMFIEFKSYKAIKKLQPS